MTLPGLLLLAILTSCDAKIAANHHDADCDDCNENGRWWPLFKPSQIIHSEFPEHAQHRSMEQGQLYNAYENEAPYSSQERAHSGSQEGVRVGSQERVHPGSQERLHSGSKEQVYSGSQEQSHSGSHEQLPPYTVTEPGSREVAGVDSRVRNYNSNEKHRVEWDHYGDVSHVTTVAYNSLEARSGVVRNSVGPVPPTLPNSVELATTSGEAHSGSVQERAPNQEYGEIPEQDASFRSQEGSFFDEGNFFDEKLASPSDSFPADFGISKESSYSDEGRESSNSIEFMNSLEGFSDFGRYKKPVATSYSSISSVFKARPILHQPRDLLHPDLTHNDVTNYITNEIRNPVSHREFDNGRNFTKPYLVHEDANEDPGVLVINHGPIGRSHRPPSFIPLDHPVYRYVKNHGGLLHQYRRHPFSRASTLQWQDVHPELRNKFPFKHLQPKVRFQNHETMVHHVVPTKSPFSDSFWKESRKIENLKPPPLGQTLYFFKKKPNTIDFKKIGRRQSPHYVYIIKKNKRLI